MACSRQQTADELNSGNIAMRSGLSNNDPVFFGAKDHIDVDRGCAEFRSGRPVIMMADGETLLTLPVEGLIASRLTAFTKLSAPIFPQLAVTARRARALSLDVAGPVALKLPADIGAEAILSLAADANIDQAIEATPAGPAAAAGIELAKLAMGLPAVLAAAVPVRLVASDFPIVMVNAEAVAHFRRGVVQSLKISAEADMPLHGGLSARFVVFSDIIGGASAAAIIGTLNPSRPVLVRLHSACLTGDVFGSRRCDCGDQLRLSLTQLDKAGGGIILYLAQEGRGLGLANKIRAYKLQDVGLDTVDANTTLGFDDDERDYDVAARMLKLLGYTRITLLTNNPAKVEGLAEGGIEVCGRLPLVAPVHADNRRYLTAKAKRAGHHLTEVLANADC
jgi:GTP cyclohydrolase II